MLAVVLWAGFSFIIQSGAIKEREMNSIQRVTAMVSVVVFGFSAASASAADVLQEKNISLSLANEAAAAGR